MATGAPARGTSAPLGGAAAAQPAGSAWPAFFGGVGLVVAFGLVAWGLREQLAKGFDKVWPLAPPPPPVAAKLPDTLTHRPEPAEPKPRVWTVGEVSTAVSTMPGEIETLVREGQQELRQLEDPGEIADSARQQRARMFFQAWGRTYDNRLKLLEKRMPKAAGCAPFSSLVAHCRAINIAIDGLRRATNMTTVAASRKTLEQTSKELQLALAPPAPSTSAQ
jgi:hypothetical protein